MKKVLILAYDFPPYHSIGSQRPYSWYKEFKELGLYPIIITRHWDEVNSEIDYYKSSKVQKTTVEEDNNGVIIRVPYLSNFRDKLFIKYGFRKFNLLRKILSIIYALGEFVFPFLDGRRRLYNEANRFLMDNPCDVIIATGEPFVLFKYGYHLSTKHNVPWVADYRDAWSLNYSKVYTDSLNSFPNLIYKKLEKKYLKSSKGIITVSSHLQKTLNQFLNSKVEIIANGYDEKVFSEYKPKEEREYFKISYLGTIYPYQKLETFLDGLNIFLQSKSNLRIKVYFYGIESYRTQLERLKAYKNDQVMKYIETTKRMPYADVIEKVSDSHLLLILAGKEVDGSASKIYDYIALNKKVLLVENDKGSLEQIINKTASGILCEDSNDVFESLNALYKEWSQKKSIEHQTLNIESYSRESQTKKLAKIIKRVANG